MAMTVQPVDGLISRLIQQNSRAGERPGESASRDGARGQPPRDRVSISSQASSQAGGASQPAGGEGMLVSREGARSLESHLLRLYREHESSGGRK